MKNLIKLANNTRLGFSPSPPGTSNVYLLCSYYTPGLLSTEQESAVAFSDGLILLKLASRGVCCRACKEVPTPVPRVQINANGLLFEAQLAPHFATFSSQKIQLTYFLLAEILSRLLVYSKVWRVCIPPYRGFFLLRLYNAHDDRGENLVVKISTPWQPAHRCVGRHGDARWRRAACRILWNSTRPPCRFICELILDAGAAQITRSVGKSSAHLALLDFCELLEKGVALVFAQKYAVIW